MSEYQVCFVAPATTSNSDVMSHRCTSGLCVTTRTRQFILAVIQWPLRLEQAKWRQWTCIIFPPELLFPVCNPSPGKGESCWSHPNLLMDMLAWDQEGPRDHCPCADDLTCQPHGWEQTSIHLQFQNPPDMRMIIKLFSLDLNKNCIVINL